MHPKELLARLKVERRRLAAQSPQSPPSGKGGEAMIPGRGSVLPNPRSPPRLQLGTQPGTHWIRRKLRLKRANPRRRGNFLRGRFVCHDCAYFRICVRGWGRGRLGKIFLHSTLFLVRFIHAFSAEHPGCLDGAVTCEGGAHPMVATGWGYCPQDLAQEPQAVCLTPSAGGGGKSHPREVFLKTARSETCVRCTSGCKVE